MSDATLNATPSDQSTQKKPRRWPYYSVLGIFLFLVLLPIGLQYGGQFALKKFGAETASIGDVDLNLFTGTLAISDLQVTYENQPTLTLNNLAFNFSWLALFKKHILIQNLSVSGLTLAIYQQGDKWIVGIPLPDAEAEQTTAVAEEESAPSTWQVGVENVNLSGLTINANYEDHAQKLEIIRLELAKLYMWEPKNISLFTLQSRINDAPFNISSELLPFDEQQEFKVNLYLQQLNLAAFKQFLPAEITQFAAALTIDTEIMAHIRDDAQIQIIQDGQINVALNEFTFDEISAKAQQLKWQGRVQVDLDLDNNATNVQTNGLVDLIIDNVQLPDLQAKVDSLQWQGQTDVRLINEQAPIISTQGEITIKGVNAQYSPLMVAMLFEQAIWQGSANVDVNLLEESLAVNGQFALNQWQLQDQQVQADLAKFSALNLNSIALNGLNTLNIDTVSLKETQALLQKKRALASLNTLTLENLRLSQLNHLDIAAITLENLAANANLNSNGHLDVIDDWLASLNQRIAAIPSEEKPAQENTANVETATPFSYRIGALRFKGNNPLTFKDNQVKPATLHSANIKTLNIGEINSRQVAQLTPLDIKIKLYQHGEFALEGNISPLQELSRMQGEINARISGIELTDISPYIENAIGYTAKSGQFNSTSQAKISQGTLDSETKVKIQRIDLQPEDEEIMARASKSLAMPISTVLKIITDKRNSMELTVPVVGDLTDPNVKINKIMTAAITQAVKNTAMTYFKYAMQPFGAILLATEAISDKVLQARFEDVNFIAGEAQIVSAQKDYLEKVARMIEEKKDFSIITCVVVTDEDFLARATPVAKNEEDKYVWDELSTDLAERRLELIRSTLIEQHNLSSSQVQGCKASIGKGQPRAVLGI